MPSGRPRSPRLRRPSRGFSLLLLLVVVALVGVVSAGAVSMGHVATRQQAEHELLAIGAEFRAALISYGAGSPATALSGPAELQDLLRDPRVPGLRRHLRKIYADPLTGDTQWGLVRGPNGRIVGIHSLAPGTPAKQTGFDDTQVGLDGATSYAQWVFSAQPIVRVPTVPQVGNDRVARP